MKSCYRKSNRYITVGRTHEMVMTNYTGSLFWKDLAGNEHRQIIAPVASQTDVDAVFTNAMSGSVLSAAKIERSLLLDVNPIRTVDALPMITSLTMEKGQIKGTFVIRTTDTMGVLQEKTTLGVTAEAVLYVSEKVQGPYVEVDTTRINMNDGSFIFDNPAEATFFKVIIRKRK